jgi:hypothetical protein
VPRNPIPPLIITLTVVALALAGYFFTKIDLPRMEATRAVLYSPSRIRLAMSVTYASGPLVEEDYSMSDTDGVSASSYRAVGRRGLQITVTERSRKTLDPGADVAFFFDKTVQDGIWELTTKPPRGDTSVRYRISIYQLTGGAHGSRVIVFTDPHYWATTGGHQYHITLDKNKPVPDLLQMTSTVLVEPRYEALVADFRGFGPQSFRDKVAAAQARLGVRPHGASA